MKFSARLRKGFTLIELLIVIVIIGILAVGLVPKVIDAPKKARDTVRKTDLNAIKIAVESWYSDKTTYPATAEFTDAKMGSYFQGGTKIPVDPSQKSYMYKLIGTCYAIGADMESASAGNVTGATKDSTDLSKVTKCDGSELKAGDSDLFVILGGS